MLFLNSRIVASENAEWLETEQLMSSAARNIKTFVSNSVFYIDLKACSVIDHLFVFMCVVTGTWPQNRLCFSRGRSEVRRQDNTGAR